MNALVLGGASMGLAALFTLLVVNVRRTGGQFVVSGAAGSH
jgi:hypothetical protein